MLLTTAAVEVESPPKVRVPDVVIVPPRRGKVVAIEVTVPLPPAGVVVAITLPSGLAARKVPAGVPSPVIAKVVDVAFVVESFGKVLVLVVVAVKWLATVSPTTENFAYGEVVPMPTLPVVSIRIFSALLTPKDKPLFIAVVMNPVVPSYPRKKFPEFIFMALLAPLAPLLKLIAVSPFI